MDPCMAQAGPRAIPPAQIRNIDCPREPAASQAQSFADAGEQKLPRSYVCALTRLNRALAGVRRRPTRVGTGGGCIEAAPKGVLDRRAGFLAAGPPLWRRFWPLLRRLRLAPSSAAPRSPRAAEAGAVPAMQSAGL